MMLDVFYPTQSFLELLELPPFFSAGMSGPLFNQNTTRVDMSGPNNPLNAWLIQNITLAYLMHFSTTISPSLPTQQKVLIDQHHLIPGQKKTPGTFPFSAPAIGRLKLLHL